jgi:serine/threonine-protein kinase
MIQAGDLIGKKYRVERLLGEGGMGFVVAAWDQQLGRRVVIKLLHPEMLRHQEVVERFVREARAAAQLESDHATRVVEVGTLHDGAPFMVMEHLEGQDLSRIAKSGERIPIGVVVAWVIEACRAIGEAHSLGIVHRDLKPHNLFLAKRRDGSQRIKVLDFGISKVAGDSNGLTRTGAGMGTPKYMAPEQALSAADVDARADIWSLGVILYQLCTGEVPYPGETPTQVYAAITTRAATPPSLVRPDLPPGLEAIILGCLERQRERRIASVQELVTRLTPFATPAESFIVEDRAGSAPGLPSGATLEPSFYTVPGDLRSTGTVPLAERAPMSSTKPLPEIAPPAPAGGGAPTLVPQGPPVSTMDAAAPERPASRRTVGAIAVALLAVASASLFFVFRGSSAERPPATTATATPPAPPAAAPASQVVVAITASTEPTPPVAPVATSARPPQIGSRPPPRIVPAPPPTVAPANCNPPYEIDRDGNRIRKPECR